MKLYAKYALIIFVLLSLVILDACKKQSAEWKGTIQEENGVEVVINHLEPYELKNEPTTLTLESTFIIDAENDNLAELGLADIRKFSVDSKGNVYTFQAPKGDESLIFKFDPSGNFLKSFVRTGQGPGEIQSPEFLNITSQDEIPVVDRSSNKISIFSRDGELKREMRFKFLFRPRGGFLLLENGNYLVHFIALEPTGEVNKIYIRLFDSQFNRITDLAEYKFPDPQKEKVSFFLDIPIVGISNSYIYIGHEKISKDILVYDLNGILRRKIRKEYRSITAPEELKHKIKTVFKNNPMRDQLYLPKYMPAFQYFFTDDEGRLYISTYEKDETSGQNICDIYSPDGIYIARESIGYFNLLSFIFEAMSLDVIVKNNYLYCLREKENGFKELLAYKMRWE